MRKTWLKTRLIVTAVPRDNVDVVATSTGKPPSPQYGARSAQQRRKHCRQRRRKHIDQHVDAGEYCGTRTSTVGGAVAEALVGVATSHMDTQVPRLRARHARLQHQPRIYQLQAAEISVSFAAPTLF